MNTYIFCNRICQTIDILLEENILHPPRNLSWLLNHPWNKLLFSETFRFCRLFCQRRHCFSKIEIAWRNKIRMFSSSVWFFEFDCRAVFMQGRFNFIFSPDAINIFQFLRYINFRKRFEYSWNWSLFSFLLFIHFAFPPPTQPLSSWKYPEV